MHSHSQPVNETISIIVRIYRRSWPEWLGWLHMHVHTYAYLRPGICLINVYTLTPQWIMWLSTQITWHNGFWSVHVEIPCNGAFSVTLMEEYPVSLTICRYHPSTQYIYPSTFFSLQPTTPCTAIHWGLPGSNLLSWDERQDLEYWWFGQLC